MQLIQTPPHKDPERLRALLDTVDSIVWEADPDTFEFTYVNQAAERLLGYPVRAWLRNPGFWEGTIYPEDREATVQQCRAASNDGHDHEFVYRAMTADGRVIPIVDAVHVVKDESGRATLLRGVMRRLGEEDYAGPNMQLGHRPIYRVASIAVDPKGHRAWKNGALLDLSRTQFALLELFVRNPGVALSREEILDHVWGDDYAGTSNVVDVYVKYLRDKLDESGRSSCIETVRGIGYRMREDA